MDDELEPGVGDLDPAAFRLIVDRTGNPFAVVDATGTVRYAGRSMQRVSGWAPEDIVGRNMAEFLPPDQLDAAVEVLSEIDRDDREGGGIPMVFELLRPDGSTTWVEIGAMPMLDEPAVQGIVLRHRSWDAQHHLDEFMRSLLADAPLAEVLASLARAIAVSLEAAAVVVHHGFDGLTFSDAVGRCVDGCDVPPGALALDVGPWVEAMEAGGGFVKVQQLDSGLQAAALDRRWESLWTAVVPETEGLGRATVSVWRHEGGGPLAGHRQAMERNARFVQLALVRTAEHQQLRHLAGHDALTGVANRTEFRDGLARALAIGERNLAVAFCDLDGFKTVNDRFGHPAGDAVLVEVADRLRSALRVGDALARMGGDEFTVLFRNVDDPAAARHVAERLQAAMEEPFRVNGVEVTVGISVGMALATADATADVLITRADEVLYEVKRGTGPRAAVWGDDPPADPSLADASPPG